MHQQIWCKHSYQLHTSVLCTKPGLPSLVRENDWSNYGVGEMMVVKRLFNWVSHYLVYLYLENAWHYEAKKWNKINVMWATHHFFGLTERLFYLREAEGSHSDELTDNWDKLICRTLRGLSLLVLQLLETDTHTSAWEAGSHLKTHWCQRWGFLFGFTFHIDFQALFWAYSLPQHSLGQISESQYPSPTLSY